MWDKRHTTQDAQRSMQKRGVQDAGRTMWGHITEAHSKESTTWGTQHRAYNTGYTTPYRWTLTVDCKIFLFGTFFLLSLIFVRVEDLNRVNMWAYRWTLTVPSIINMTSHNPWGSTHLVQTQALEHSPTPPHPLSPPM